MNKIIYIDDNNQIFMAEKIGNRRFNVTKLEGFYDLKDAKEYLLTELGISVDIEKFTNMEENNYGRKISKN